MPDHKTTKRGSLLVECDDCKHRFYATQWELTGRSTKCKCLMCGCTRLTLTTHGTAALAVRQAAAKPRRIADDGPRSEEADEGG